MPKDDRYHPADVRYKGPSTAYRGTSRLRQASGQRTGVPAVSRERASGGTGQRPATANRQRSLASTSASALRRVFWLYRVVAFVRAWIILILMAGVVIYAFYVDAVAQLWP